MTGLTRDQLEALRRQIEEDYRMDIAAIDRLMRRFSFSGVSTPAPVYSPASNAAPLSGAPLNGSVLVDATAPAPQPAPLPSASPEPQNDELAGSIRAMFNSYRK